MLHITINKNTREIILKGHAGAGERGRDIVCAAASMCYGMFKQSLLDHQEWLTDYSIEENGDYTYIAYIPKEGYKEYADLIFFHTVRGFESLFNSYKQNICLELVENQ